MHYTFQHMSKLRLLLETDDETNVLCLQWVSYIPGTTADGVLLLVYGTGRKAYKRWVLYYYAHSGM